MAKEEKTTKRDLVEILETDCEDREAITLLLEKALSLKTQIGTEPDKKKGTEGSGLLKEYDDVKDELGALQKIHGFEGLRHNNIAFVMSPRDGRETIDSTQFVQELVARGIDPKLVAEATVAATKTGKVYYVREIVDLNVKKKGRTDKSKGEWG